MKKTPLMRQIEGQQDEILETLLPRLISRQGQAQTARELHIGKATLNTWMLKFRIEVHHIAVPADQTLATLKTRGGAMNQGAP